MSKAKNQKTPLMSKVPTGKRKTTLLTKIEAREPGDQTRFGSRGYGRKKSGS